MYVDRTYRERYSGSGLVGFRVVVKDSDLFILVDESSYSSRLEKIAEQQVIYWRGLLEAYIASDPKYKTTLKPHVANLGAPDIVLEMAKAGNLCGVGPMAAVAGAIAERVGKELKKHVKEVIVENGGDLFLDVERIRHIGVFAGQSPFSDKLALKIYPDSTPVGICTSSGTIGPSLSFGKADAVIIRSSSTALADAAATAIGNIVLNKDDVKKGIQAAQRIKGVSGAVVIKEDQLAAWGEMEILPWQKIKS